MVLVSQQLSGMSSETIIKSAMQTLLIQLQNWKAIIFWNSSIYNTIQLTFTNHEDTNQYKIHVVW